MSRLLIDAEVEARLPVPRENLLEVGLTDEEIDKALSCPPRFFTYPDPPETASFDVDRVIKVLAVFGHLRHTKTKRFGGLPLTPDPWQVVWIIAPVFGWIDENGCRLVREVFIEVPRKNGKSTLATGLALYLLCADGEDGAEVYSAAVDRTQATRILDDAKRMVLGSPMLAERAIVQASLIKYPKTNGIMRALSRVAEAAHGLNVHGGIIDELHVHKNRDLVEAITSGTDSRDQPLILIITTADDGSEHTVYAEYHNRVLNGHNKVASFDRFAGMVWAAGEDDDPFDLDVIKSANPSWGTALNPDGLNTAIEKAKENPAELASFRRLRLNVRSKTSAGLLDMTDWRACAVDEFPDLTDKSCFGGFDLSSVSDFTAAALVFPPDERDGLWHVKYKCWLPEGQFDKVQRQCKVPLGEWVSAGHVGLTEGDAVDYQPLVDWFSDAIACYDLRWVGFDRWNAGDVSQRIFAEGVRVEPVQQTYTGITSPTKLLSRLVISNKLRHEGDACLTWQASNLNVLTDGNDNVRPDKPDRYRSSARIDAMVAIITALFGVERNWQMG